MGQRLDLQTLLESLTPNVYFQPPNNIQMQYPCIVYERDFARTEFAGNDPYRYEKRYQVTYIDRDPDSPVPDEIAKLRRCTFERHFKANNLNHDVFTIFF